MQLKDLPALGQPLLAGLFVGLTSTPDGLHHAVILLPNKPDGPLKWEAAQAWAGEQDGVLPSRPISALLFANAKDQFESAWYWTSESDADDGSYAWGQYFYYGGQYYDHKSYEGRARAVRLIQLVA